MLKNYLFILLIVLIVAVRSELANVKGVSSQQDVHASVVVDSDITDDTIRVLSFGEIGGAFFVSGASVNIEGNSAEASTSAFFFSSGLNSYVSLPLSYFYTYANSQVSPGSVNSQGVVAAFVPSVLIEYEEKNGQTGFQLDSTDTVLGWIRLDKYGAFDIQDTQSTINATKDGKPVTTKLFVIDATSPDGVFGLRFTVAGAPVTINGAVSISSEQSKVDILINDYYNENVNRASLLCSTSSARFSCQSTGPSSNVNSRLALASFFLSTSYDVSASIKTNTMSVTGGDVEVGLNWVTSVQVNGTKSASVSSTASASANGKSFMSASISANYQGNLIINSFDSIRPASIYFDPIIGANVETSSSSILSISLVFIILSVITTLLF